MFLLLHLRKVIKKIFQRIRATYNTNCDILTNSYITALNKAFQSMQHSNFAFPSLLCHRYSSLINNFNLLLSYSSLSPMHSEVLRLFNLSSKSLKYAKGMFKSQMVNICLSQSNIGEAHFPIQKHGKILPQKGHHNSQQNSKVCLAIISLQNLANSLAFTSPVYICHNIYPC